MNPRRYEFCQFLRRSVRQASADAGCTRGQHALLKRKFMASLPRCACLYLQAPFATCEVEAVKRIGMPCL